MPTTRPVTEGDGLRADLRTMEIRAEQLARRKGLVLLGHAAVDYEISLTSNNTNVNATALAIYGGHGQHGIDVGASSISYNNDGLGRDALYIETAIIVVSFGANVVASDVHQFRFRSAMIGRAFKADQVLINTTGTERTLHWTAQRVVYGGSGFASSTVLAAAECLGGTNRAYTLSGYSSFTRFLLPTYADA